MSLGENFPHSLWEVRILNLRWAELQAQRAQIPKCVTLKVMVSGAIPATIVSLLLDSSILPIGSRVPCKGL